MRSRVLNRSVPSSIFVAHSQGGVISRRVAQGDQRPKVRALITTGTPHLGAPIANTATPGPGTNGVVNAVTGSTTSAVTCRLSLGCGPVRLGLTALRDGLFAAAMSSPGARDLRPGSSALALVNGTTETTDLEVSDLAFWGPLMLYSDGGGRAVAAFERRTRQVAWRAPVTQGQGAYLFPRAPVVVGDRVYYMDSIEGVDAGPGSHGRADLVD